MDTHTAEPQKERPLWLEDALDRLAMVGDAVDWIWHKKLWWMVPLLLALLLLTLLVVLQATPVGPLIYPVF
jgi:hypothetical protein